ncbi:MAG: T9SS type A sorting domain-containing protein [Saprospiraceae bacterium]|nr:T9SS type A sorting domain-containing protein [Saprospiraceae bacterium]
MKLQLRNCAFPLKEGAVVTIYVTLIDNGPNCDLYCPLEPITFIIPECRDCISQARVTSCPTVVEPVCGCNNLTYNNSCEAERQGVTTWSPGACPGSDVNNTPNSEARTTKPTVNYELNNAPNPFSNSTVIRFNLPNDMDATISVMGMDGRVVFEESGTFVAGWNEVHFEETINLSGGMYFYRLQTEEQVLTKTMILTKE